MPDMNIRIDIVYTWVDDSQPGYLEDLERYSVSSIDRNPNRTRDNLDLLKFSLRSVERYTDWKDNIYLFTRRPQIPRWLNSGHENLRLVHHDEVIDPVYLPTFNSFCIVSYLAQLEGISDPFLYIEDDMLFTAETSLADFLTVDRKIILYPRMEKTTPATKQHDDRQPPWNMALSYCNFLLDNRYGRENRYSINRVPILIFKDEWKKMIDTWKDAFEYTRQSRFRSRYNVAPEFLYPYNLLYRKRGHLAGFRDTYRKSCYLGLDNNLLLAKTGLFLLGQIKPRFCCLNDNFGETPNPRVENAVRQFLEERFPDKSSFEI